MSYKLNGVDITTFGAYPIVSSDAIALSGIFDLPKRIGTTEYNWGTCIEPFVDTEDIELDGRTLTLRVVLNKESLQAYKKACISCTTLGTDLGDFKVKCKDAIICDYFDDGRSTVETKFYQKEYIPVTLSLTESKKGYYMLDSYSLGDFGIIVNSISGLDDVGKNLEINTTIPYTQSTYRETNDISLRCCMKGDNISSMYAMMMQLHALCYKSGLRTLKIGEKDVYKLYFKDGIVGVKVPTTTMLIFDLKCKVVE